MPTLFLSRLVQFLAFYIVVGVVQILGFAYFALLFFAPQWVAESFAEQAAQVCIAVCVHLWSAFTDLP